MKKCKIFILTLTLLLAFPLQAKATEMQEPTTEESKVISNYYELDSDYDEVNDTIDYYNQLIKGLSIDLQDKKITQEEFDKRLKEIDEEKKNTVTSLESQIQESEDEKNADTVSGSDTGLNRIIVTDDNGNAITDYTNVDFSNMPNKRSITFKCQMEDGTTPDDKLSISITGNALNLKYTTTVTLDKSNNYTAVMEVPNDTYSFTYDCTKTNDSVTYDDGFIDASANPTQILYVYGSKSIVSNNTEITQIEGSEYVEPKQEKQTNYTTVFKIVGGVVLVVAVIGFVLFAIKKKKDNEF